MNSNTPRTDGAMANAPAECWTATAVEMARKLERENSLMREALEYIASYNLTNSMAVARKALPARLTTK